MTSKEEVNSTCTSEANRFHEILSTLKILSILLGNNHAYGFGIILQDSNRQYL